MSSVAGPAGPVIGRYRKKPVVIEAVQFKGGITSARSVAAWIRAEGGACSVQTENGSLSRFSIDTLEGPMRVKRGAWVIRGVEGEFYACDPDIFAKTYEEAT